MTDLRSLIGGVLFVVALGALAVAVTRKDAERECADAAAAQEHELRVKACTAVQGRLMVSALHVEAGPRAVAVHRADIEGALVEAAAYAPACITLPAATRAAVARIFERGGSTDEVLADGVQALGRELDAAARDNWPRGR